MGSVSLIVMQPGEVNSVRTTGIYCRAGCGGRPKESNTARYRSAVAAEAAGYRPCLQCRPDRQPRITLDAGSPPVVEHAMVLISEGFLDRHTEPQLAARVGHSARQLRRLFDQHLGASPALIAQSRRAHFARRLLDETDLPITEIAFSAGFGSLRQMNRVMRQIFHFTPGDLRRKRRIADRLVADGGTAVRIAYRPPFEFSRMLAYLAARAIPGVESIADGAYRRVTDTCGHPGAVEIGDAEDGKHLILVSHLPGLAGLVDDVARARRMFGIDTDLGPARHALRSDRHLGPLLVENPGVTVPGSWDRFETAIRIIVGQQISVAGASTITGRIASRYGQPVNGLEQWGLSTTFPTAATLADVDLDGCGLTDTRRSTIRGFSKAVADGTIDLHRVGGLASLIDDLCALPGIGPWTAHVIALRVHGHPDAFPDSDLAIRRKIETLADGAPAESITTPWQPHRALAAMLLWQGSVP